MNRFVRIICTVAGLFLCLSAAPLYAQSDLEDGIRAYSDEYIRTEDVRKRLGIANRFFDYLYSVKYIDEPIVFPAGSHIDSVDVNVYYYIAEYHYSNGNYPLAVDYCSRAEECFGLVDDLSKADIYALKAAAYFRMGEFDKVVATLHNSYEIDRKSGDFDRLSSTLNGIASAFVAAGNPQEAEKYILEALAASSLTTNLARKAVLMGTASEMYKAMGDDKQSVSYARQALAIERQIGDSARVGVRLSQLANAELEAGNVKEARQHLLQAIPLLYEAHNYHSWGICQNQMGDIFASQGNDEEAAKHYREAATYFMKHNDKYNEMHAREGLYKATKNDSPSEAMIHLERAKILRDSIYSTETSEAIARYNALYYNNLLLAEKDNAKHRYIFSITISLITLGLLLMIILLGAWITYRRHRRSRMQYEEDIHSLQSRYDEVQELYRRMVTVQMQSDADLTEDDREFLNSLITVIDTAEEEGLSDVNALAEKMHINTVALRRRLKKITSMAPQAYILQIRMQKAKFLLQNYRDMTIAEVTDRCGYAQVANFTRAFTRFYGMTPTEARMQALDASGKEKEEKSHYMRFFRKK
jgi:AraC-like DNA-binding protein